VFEAVLGVTVLAAAIGIGGGLYEFIVVDPVWPRLPHLVQPTRGGISRKRFWIPAHVLFELLLIGSLVAAWNRPAVRDWLLVGLASHAAMRIWSAFDFIPKALAFERMEASQITPETARRWTRRSRLRLPLDLATFGAVLAAFWTAARGAAI
jgi:hypothetical protein